MKQNKQQKNLKSLVNSKRRLALVGGLSLLVVGQLAFDALVAYRLLTQAPDLQIVDYIVDSVDNLSKPGVVDPVNKRIYMPEANMVLPFYPSGISGIRYGYSAPDNGSGASLLITSNNAIERSRSNLKSGAIAEYGKFPALNEAKTYERVFNDVPGFQACARGFEIAFGDSIQAERPNAEQIGAKILADGRRVAIFREKDCAHQPENMTEYIKQIQSY